MNHSQSSEKFLRDKQRTGWHDASLWFVREKRDAVAKAVPEWETLRTLASEIKQQVLSDLDQYLISFEKNAQKNGVHVHWARDGKTHNEIVFNILQKHHARSLVKSKSMLTEECGLNEFLLANDIEVIDTDLGERIVQLAEEPPSHIVMPAIHKKKAEIGELFHQTIGTEKGNSDPAYLTEAARQHLREKFLRAEAALTGVNFAIAETGGVVVCTNEGNADMGVHLAPLQIHSMGIEKILPRAEHLGIFLRLLARSATGQLLTTYTSHYHRPKPGGEMHIIIVDNGRSEQLGQEKFRQSLCCIRCGACMNTCPVYRRSGGHSYGSVIPGPIGSILTPGMPIGGHPDLPFASTLCGSCNDVCPVKIDIHQQLYHWRQHSEIRQAAAPGKKRLMQFAAWLFSHPQAYRLAGKTARLFLRMLPRKAIYHRWNHWGLSRELPVAPRESFREWYDKNEGKK